MLLAFAMSFLPCGIHSAACLAPFAPPPDALLSAFLGVGQGAHFFIYYFGTSIGDAFVTCFDITMLAGLLMMLWRVLINFRIPILSRIIHGQQHKDL